MRIRDPSTAGCYWHIVLSPHFDDAVLSLGGTIPARLRAEGERVLIVTFCAGIPRASLELGPTARRIIGRRTPEGWVMSRRDEDREAMERLDADWFWDGALDAILRMPAEYGADRARLFGPPVAGDPLVVRATATIFLLEHAARRAFFYAPLAIGGHVDHRIIHEATRRAVWPHAIGWYEDFPYVMRGDARARRLDEVRRELGRLEELRIDVGATLDARIEAIAAYRSQVPRLFGTRAEMTRAVRACAGRDPTERIWVSS